MWLLFSVWGVVLLLGIGIVVGTISLAVKGRRELIPLGMGILLAFLALAVRPTTIPRPPGSTRDGLSFLCAEGPALWLLMSWSQASGACRASALDGVLWAGSFLFIGGALSALWWWARRHGPDIRLNPIEIL